MSEALLHALVRGLVDYAGLFPPAQLDMTAAVAEYARERRTDDAWMLARFIVPVGRLAEFEDAARVHLLHTDGPWPLSVLAGGDPEADRARIDVFNAAHAGRAVIEAVELKAAAVLARRASVGVGDLVALLEERDAAAFEVDGGGVRWRRHAMSAEDLAATRRDFATSYGSCSFREPVDELRELRLL